MRNHSDKAKNIKLSITEVFVKTKLKPAWHACILLGPAVGIVPFRRKPKRSEPQEGKQFSPD